MLHRHEQGEVRLTLVFLLIGLVVTAVWIWKRTPPDIQDYVVEQVVPAMALACVVATGGWLLVRPIRKRRAQREQRTRLLTAFKGTRVWEKRRDLAFQLVEINGYQRRGIEEVAGELTDIFSATLKQAVGDKQHRLRGMAASHLGALNDPASVPALLAALDDDHAYVRSCAALGLGRMRAIQAKEKLAVMMKDDWDQTVRSRAREAWERIG
ncbi:MAG: HEAT repeat domain-containing protein [Nitrospiraceae bacterium]